MNFSVNSKQLLSALNLTAKGINTNSNITSTSNYRFKAIDKGLEISTCNLEISMQTMVNCEITEPLDILIPADKITRLLSSLSDQPLTFNINRSDINIKWSSGQCDIVGSSAELFPEISIETNSEMRIESQDLTEAVFATAYARHTDPVLGCFIGLSIRADKSKLQFAACNLLALSVFNLKGKFKPAELLLPPSLTNSIPNITGDCIINYSDKSICLEYPNLTIKSLLMDEKYRDYLSIIPKNDIAISFDRTQFLSALKRVLEFTNKEKKIFLTSLGDKLTIIGKDESYRQQADETISISSDEKEISLSGGINIGLNGQMLSECLSHLGSEMVELKYKDERTAILINEMGDDSESFVMLMAMVND